MDKPELPRLLMTTSVEKPLTHWRFVSITCVTPISQISLFVWAFRRSELTQWLIITRSYFWSEHKLKRFKLMRVNVSLQNKATKIIVFSNRLHHSCAKTSGTPLVGLTVPSRNSWHWIMLQCQFTYCIVIIYQVGTVEHSLLQCGKFYLRTISWALLSNTNVFFHWLIKITTTKFILCMMLTQCNVNIGKN